MRIGLLLPSIYMSPALFGDMIFAPRDLSIALADGLIDKGHEVYFFTTPDTKTKAILIDGDNGILGNSLIKEELKGQLGERLKWASFYTLRKSYEMDLTERCYKMALDGKLDIIHSYHDNQAHFFNELTQFPTVYTLHDPLPVDKNTLSYWLLEKFKQQSYISISKVFQKLNNLGLNFVDNVYHGISLSDYEFDDLSQNHAIYFGRIVEEKGLDLAIQVVKELKLTIKIASSKVRDDASEAYYEDKIAPQINGQDVINEGFLIGKAKSDFIRNGKVFLLPLRWDEPFGLVMIEAMACGTPVVAFARGSAPEIIKDGETGFIVNESEDDVRGDWVIKKTGTEGFREAVERIYTLPDEEYHKMRKNCRKRVEENFTVEKMVEGYENVYKKVLENSKKT
jgi:glycosyltransferase involved in cell wall biosynthesis